jgi:hypothetical protein
MVSGAWPTWLVVLPSVIFGGYSFLVPLHGKLTAQQQTFFRAGHAHAGVLLIFSLAYYQYLGLTSLGALLLVIAMVILVYCLIVAHA